MEAGHRHTHSGLNAYLLANLKDRFLKKQTKRQNKKRNKKKKPTRRYVDKQVGSGLYRFKGHPHFRKSRSARLESQTPPSAHAPPCSPTAACRGGKGPSLATLAKWSQVQEEGQANPLSPSLLLAVS